MAFLRILDCLSSTFQVTQTKSSCGNVRGLKEEKEKKLKNTSKVPYFFSYFQGIATGKYIPLPCQSIKRDI